jgi:hypothetical protein
MESPGSGPTPTRGIAAEAPSEEQVPCLRDWDTSKNGSLCICFRDLTRFSTEQECEQTIATAVVNQSKMRWETTLRTTLGNQYEMIIGHTLQATHIIVFVHKAITPLITDCRSSAVPCGIGNQVPRSKPRAWAGYRANLVCAPQLGNKGGIGVSMKVSSTTFLFVVAHFAAGQKAVDSRNQDHHRICSELIK